MANYDDDYDPDFDAGEAPQAAPAFGALAQATSSPRLTGQIAQTPQPIYQDQNPDNQQLEVPRNYTGDSTYDASQFAEPSPAASGPPAGDFSQLAPMAAASLAVRPGRSVQSIAPIRSVTNSQGAQVPIDADGNDELSPIPGNTKYVKGKNGEVYHAQPDENGTFTRAEDSLVKTPDGQGRLRSHVPGLGYIDQGEDAKYTAAQAEKAQKAQDKADKDAAKAAQQQAQAGTNNLLAQSQYGAAGTAYAKQTIADITKTNLEQVQQATLDHKQATEELASAKADYQALLDTRAKVNPELSSTHQLMADTAAQKFAKDGKRINQAVLVGPNAHAATPWDEDEDEARKPLAPEWRKKLEEQAAAEKSAQDDAKARLDAAQKKAAFAQTQIDKAKAAQIQWKSTSDAYTLGVKQTENAIKYIKAAKILINTGRDPSQEAQPATIPPPADGGKYDPNGPQPTDAQRQDAVAAKLIDEGKPTLHTPTINVTGQTATEPQTMGDPQKPYLAALSKADHGTVYNVAGGILKYADDQVRDAMGKPVSDLVDSTQPRFYLKPDSSGQFHSLSLNSGHPYDGVPEYASPMPFHVEAMKAAGIDTTDKAAVQSAWESNHWTPEQEAAFLTKWQASNDYERQGIIAEASPDQAGLPEGQRALNTRALVQSGQLSLQQARHLDFQTKGRTPGITPFDDAFQQFQSSDAPEAKQLRASSAAAYAPPSATALALTVGAAGAVSPIIGAGAKDKALQDAIAASAADYYKRNSNSPDFDPVAFEKAKQRAYGRNFGPMERLGSAVSGTLQGLLGFGASMPVGTANEILGTGKRLVKAEAGPGGTAGLQATIDPNNIVGDTAASVGVHANTAAESEIVRQRTQSFGSKFASFFADRMNWDSAKDLAIKAGNAITSFGVSAVRDYMNPVATPGLEGKSGAQMANASDKLFALADSGQLTKDQIQKLGIQLRDATISAHGITNFDPTGKVGNDYNGRYDVTDPRSPLFQMLASYAETRDPAYKAMFKNVLSNSAGDEETQKWLADYAAAHGHIQGSTTGAIVDFANRLSGGALHYQDPGAWDALKRGIDTHQGLQNQALTEAMGAFSAAPELLTGIFKGAAPNGLRSAGAAVLDSARVANGAAKIEDVLANYTTRPMLPAASPVAAGLSAIGHSAAHGAAFMGASAVGEGYGTSAKDVANQAAAGAVIGGAMGAPNAVTAAMGATPSGQAAQRVQNIADRLSKLFPDNPPSADTVRQAMNYMAPTEPQRLAMMQDVARQITDIKERLANRAATPEEVAALPELRKQLDGHFVTQQGEIAKTVAAAQEVNGINDPVTKGLVHGILKSRQSGQLTADERKGVLIPVDTTAQPDVNGQYPSLAPEQADGSFIPTDAGWKIINDGAPGTSQRYGFPKTETEQREAIKDAQQVPAEIPPQVAGNAPNPAQTATEQPSAPNVHQQHADAAKAAMLAKTKPAEQPAPEVAQDPRAAIHYEAQPGGAVKATSETHGHPAEFPSDTALHQHFGTTREATPQEVVDRLRRGNTRMLRGELATHRDFVRARKVARGEPVPEHIPRRYEVRAEPIETPNAAPEEAPNATRPESAPQPEHQGVPPGADVPEHSAEVRQETSGQTGGGSGVQRTGAQPDEETGKSAREAAKVAPARSQIEEQLKGSPALLSKVQFLDHTPSDMEGYGGMSAGRDGSIRVSLPTLEKNIENMTPDQARAHIAKTLDEEVDHHAQWQAARNLHQQLAPDEDFDTWHKQYYGDLWEHGFSRKQRAVVENAYGVGIKGDHLKAMEGLRMISQNRRLGDQSETSQLWSKLSPMLLDHLKAVFDYLKTLAKGKLRPELEQQLQNVKAILEEHGYTGPNLEAPEAEKRTAALNDIFSKIRDREHAAKVAATPPEDFHAQADALDKAADHIEAKGGSHHVEPLRQDADKLRQTADNKILNSAPADAPTIGRHGGWLSESGGMAKVDAMWGHADVGESLIDGLKIKKESDYDRLYEKHFARLVQTPDAVYVTYGKETLNSRQKSALEHVAITTGKRVILDDPRTGRQRTLYDYRGPSDALHSAPVRDPDNLDQQAAELLRDHLGNDPAAFDKYVKAHLGDMAPEGYAERLHALAFPEAEKEPAKEVPPQKPRAVNSAAIYNDAIDEKRMALGLDPIMKAAARDHPTLWAEAEQKLSSNPRAGDEVVKKFEENFARILKDHSPLKRHQRVAPTDLDHVLMLHAEIERTTALNQAVHDVGTAKDDNEKFDAYARMEDATDRLNEVHEALRSAGSEWGRSGRARQLLKKNAVDFASMVEQMTAIRGEKLKPEEILQVKARSEAIRAAHEEVERTQDAITAARAHEGLYRAQAEQARRSPKPAMAPKARLDSLKALRDSILKKKGPLNAAPSERSQIGTHGGWLDSSGNLTRVDSTYGHADVIERLAEGVKIQKPEDYEQAYNKRFARLTTTPEAIYVSYGKEVLSPKQKAALEKVAMDTGKRVILDMGGREKVLYDYREPESLHSAPRDPLADFTDVGMYHLADGKTDYGDWKKAMADDFGDSVKPHLEPVFRRAMDELKAQQAADAKAATPEGVVASIKAKATPGEITPDQVKRLARAHIDAGHEITDAASSEALTGKIHESLKEIHPEATLDEVRDIAGNYKEREHQTKEGVEKQLSEFQKQSQRLAKLADIAEGKAPLKQGSPEKLSDENRRLDKEIREGMEREGLVSSDPAKELATRHDRIKTGLENQVKDLEDTIAGKVKPDLTKPPVADTPEIKGLRDRVKELKKAVALMDSVKDANEKARVDAAIRAAEISQREYVRRVKDRETAHAKEKTPETNKAVLAAQKARDSARKDWEEFRKSADANLPGALFREAQAKLDAATKREADLRAKLAKGDLSVTTKQPGFTTSPLEEARARTKQLAAELRTRQLASGALDARKLRQYQASLDKRSAKLEEQRRTGNFTNQPREPYKYKDDALAKEAEAAKGTYNDVVKEWEKDKERARLAGRGKIQKIGDWWLKIRRAQLLSSYVIGGKLASAAAYQTIMMIPDEVAGGILSHVPGVSGIAKGAPVEGGSNLSAVGRAIVKGWTEGITNFGKHWREGATRIDKEHGDDFMKHLDPSIWDFIGHLHQALKAPAKIAGFEYALEKGLSWAEKNGLDPRDPLVMATAAQAAYTKSQRQVFGNNNSLTDAYKAFVKKLEGNSRTRGGTNPVLSNLVAFVLKDQLPIVKVSTNIPLSVVNRSPIGLGRAISETAKAHYLGIDRLTPDQKDTIVRHLKEGSVGTALWALGFYGAAHIGGFYQQDKKKQNRQGVPADRFEVGGKITPSWATHAPAFDAMTAGATYAHIMQSIDRDSGKKRSHNNGMTALQVVGGLADKIPFVDFPKRILRAQESEKGTNLLIGEEIASHVVPAAVRDWSTGKGFPEWLAKRLRPAGMDVTPQGAEIKRTPSKAHPVQDEIKMQVPFLRSTVPKSTHQPGKSAMVSPTDVLKNHPGRKLA